MRVLYLTIVSLLPLSPFELWGQQFPDGTALLQHSQDAFKSYNTYQYTHVTNTGMAGMEMTMVQQGTSTGKMRMEMKMGSMDAALVISDGQNTWMYMGMLKRYMKVPADAAAMGGLAGALGGGQTGVGQLNLDAKVVRSETLDVDGETHDCWVVESRVGDFAPVAGVAHGVRIKGGISTHWIDKISGIEFKSVMSSKVQVPGGRGEIDTTATTLLHSVKFNQPLDDSLFVFIPPPDAKETDELFPGMKERLAKAVEPAPPAPKAGEPQAYVPNLTPIEEIEAVYPEAARSANVQGFVEVLVTIDPAGSVVKAEALTGATVLRKAAVDAVQQWKFRPVIRKGNPVFAYAKASVNLVDPTKPFKPEASDTDLSGSISMLQRLDLLEEQFPRSPQQALADLEQDRSGDVGIRRSSALPELAKAALTADDLGKASSYAREALTGPMAGDGVHDGNMVLGMIAMRQGNTEQAKHYLNESSKTSGSPVLGSFGPNMMLAKALLEKGERDSVLDYFTACRRFWKMGAQQLDTWTAAVRRGEMPNFGANLAY